MNIPDRELQNITDWHSKRLTLPSGYTGKGITVAVIDMLFGPHPWINSTSSRKTWFVDPTSDRFPQSKIRSAAGHPGTLHGNGVAGIIGSVGTVRGIAPDVNMLLVKGNVFRQKKRAKRMLGGGTDLQFSELLHWVISRAEDYQTRILVITQYCTCGDSIYPWQACPLSRAAYHANQAGILVVCSAGNSARSLPSPPCGCPDVLCVGGVEDGWSGLESWKAFGNYGTTPDGRILPALVAPVEAPIPIPEKTPQEQRENENGPKELVNQCLHLGTGTSFSAPLVAGVAALCLEANSRLAPQQIKEILLKTATKLPGLPHERQGAGLVNPAAAVAAAKNMRPKSSSSLGNTTNQRSTSIQSIKKAISSTDESKRNHAFWLLFTNKRGISYSDALDLLFALTSQYPEVVCAVIHVISRFLRLRRILINECLENHPSPHVRFALCRAISWKDDEYFQNLLIKLFADKSNWVRPAASGLSGKSKSAKFIPLLLEAITEPDNWPLFCGARQSLEKLTGLKVECTCSPKHSGTDAQQCISRKWKQWYEDEHQKDETARIAGGGTEKE